jgi:hypothetical protein
MSCSFWTVGEGPSAPTAARDERAVAVEINDSTLAVTLADGRVISVSLTWYPRLYFASPRQRREWRLVAEDIGMHWPEVDEDIAVEDMLRGDPAPRHSHLIQTCYETTSAKGV